MTKKEAIEFIKSCAKNSDAPYGFMVVAISREDLACHHSDEVVEEFDKFRKRKKEMKDLSYRLKKRKQIKPKKSFNI